MDDYKEFDFHYQGIEKIEEELTPGHSWQDGYEPKTQYKISFSTEKTGVNFVLEESDLRDLEAFIGAIKSGNDW